MTNQEILEGNDLLAKFMGMTYEDSWSRLWKPNINITPPEFFNYLCEQMGDYKWYIDELKFNLDWNWIMPVVEKIEKLPEILSFDIFSCDVIVQLNSGRMLMEDCAKQPKLQAVYKACIRIIKEHNENS